MILHRTTLCPKHCAHAFLCCHAQAAKPPCRHATHTPTCRESSCEMASRQRTLSSVAPQLASWLILSNTALNFSPEDTQREAVSKTVTSEDTEPYLSHQAVMVKQHKHIEQIGLRSFHTVTMISSYTGSSFYQNILP